MFNIFFPENLDVYEIMWKRTVEPGRSQMTVWRMRIACWTPKATEYLILYCLSTATMVAQTHLTLRYTYSACLVYLYYFQI